MGVHCQKERPINLLRLAVITNGLGDCQDVPRVERSVESGATMTARPEDNPLLWVSEVRLDVIVGSNQLRDIHQD